MSPRVARVTARLGLFVLALSVTGIARMANTRGASSWRYGLLAGMGWLFVGVFTAALLPGLGFGSSTGELTNGGTFIATIVPWAYVGLVALYVRFRIGRGVEGPSGSWSCSQCHTLNQGYAAEMRKLRRAFRCATCGLTSGRT
jgi:hypothetical protein